MSDSAETMRINKFVTANGDGKIWSAGIDIKKDSEWHYNAIECHSSERELAIARRDAVFAALSASGTKSDGGVESRHAKTGNMSGAVPEEEQSLPASGFVRAFGPEDKTSKPRDGVAPIPSDPIPSQPDEREAIAEAIWRAEYRRATGRERSIPWSEVSSTDRERYRYVADAILAMQAERRGAKS